MPKLRSFQDCTAVVTGASSGIGRALAQRLAGEGARVALVARRQAELEAVASQIGSDALVLPCDVADRRQVDAAAAQAIDRFGHIDLLVNNAGYGHHRRFIDWDIADMVRMMRVNYFGAVHWTQALLPQMVSRKSGWLVFVSSVAGKIGVPLESSYAATKFAMLGLAEALDVELERDGVHVLSVCPGTVRTEFFDEEALASMPPASRRLMIEPDEVAGAIIDALRRGKREITVPRRLSVAYLVKALAPAILRSGVKRSTIGSVAKEKR